MNLINKWIKHKSYLLQKDFLFLGKLKWSIQIFLVPVLLISIGILPLYSSGSSSFSEIMCYRFLCPYIIQFFCCWSIYYTLNVAYVPFFISVLCLLVFCLLFFWVFLPFLFLMSTRYFHLYCRALVRNCCSVP